MKIGMRTPSVKKSISAKTTGKFNRSLKKAANPFYGKKGTGLLTNPKKSIYNKVYNKTTVDVRGGLYGCLCLIVLVCAVFYFLFPTQKAPESDFLKSIDNNGNITVAENKGESNMFKMFNVLNELKEDANQYSAEEVHSLSLFCLAQLETPYQKYEDDMVELFDDIKNLYHRDSDKGSKITKEEQNIVIDKINELNAIMEKVFIKSLTN